MKKNIIFIVLFFSITALYGQKAAKVLAKEVQKKTVYITYTDSKEQVSVKYPDTWRPHANSQTVFMFMRPVEEKGQRFRENVNLVIGDAQDLALVEYLVDARNKMKEQMPGFKELKSKFLKINNIDFVKMIYTFTSNGITLKSVLFLAVDNGKAYSLTCAAINSTFDRFYPIFDKIGESFRINVRGK